MFKEIGSNPGFYTHKSFLGILYKNKFFFGKKKQKWKIFTFWLGFAEKKRLLNSIMSVCDAPKPRGPIDNPSTHGILVDFG